MADEYYIRRNGKVSGPHSMESIKAAAKSKKLTAEDMIGTSKDGPWKKMNLGSKADSTSEPPPVPKTARKPKADDADWMDEPIEEAELEGDDDLPPLPVSPRKSNRKKLEEEDEKAERKKKPKKVKESSTAGLVLRIVIWVVVGMAITVGLGVTFLARNVTDVLAKKDQKEAPAKNDLAALASQPKIPQIDRIVIEIDASLSVGMNKEQLTTKLQQLATEIQLAQREGKKVEKYEKTLEIYKDAISLWEALHTKYINNGNVEKYPLFMYLTANNQLVWWEYKYNKGYENDELYLHKYKAYKTVTDILNRYDLWADVIQNPLDESISLDKNYQEAGAAKGVQVPVACFFKLTSKARAMIGR